MVEWAFAEYFKTGTFPPKPADLCTVLRLKREAMQVLGESCSRPVTENEYQAMQQDRKDYFESDEYKAFLERMKAKGI